MRQIERYVMVELLRVFGVLITISTMLFVFVGVFAEAQKQDLGIWQTIQVMPYFIPVLMPYTIPATLLLSVCVIYGRMAGDCEIIAVRAAGIHLMHLMWPAFFIAASLSVVTLILTDQVTPWAYRKMEQIIALAIEDIFLDKLRTESQISSKQHGITISVTDVQGRKLIQPIIRYTPRGGKPATIQAKEAYIEFDLPKQQVWLTMIGINGNFAGNSVAYSKNDRFSYALPSQKGTAGDRIMRMQDLLASLETHEKNRKNVTQRRVMEASFALVRGDFDRLQVKDPLSESQLTMSTGIIRRVRTEYYNRLATSVNSFFVVLLGTPFAILMAKKQFLTSFLFCFLPILTIYYPIVMMAQNMSKSGQIDPSWSAWLANGVLLIAASCTIHRVLRN